MPNPGNITLPPLRNAMIDYKRKKEATEETILGYILQKSWRYCTQLLIENNEIRLTQNFFRQAITLTKPYCGARKKNNHAERFFAELIARTKWQYDFPEATKADKAAWHDIQQTIDAKPTAITQTMPIRFLPPIKHRSKQGLAAERLPSPLPPIR